MRDDDKILKTCFKEIISITYYGRSGSIFLQSLFDNHPNNISNISWNLFARLC